MSEEDLTGKSADGEGIDHFSNAYGEQIIGAFRAVQGFSAGRGRQRDRASSAGTPTIVRPGRQMSGGSPFRLDDIGPILR